MTSIKITNYSFVFVLLAVIPFIGFDVAGAYAEDVLCDDMKANIQLLQQEDEKLKKDEKDARNKASDVYKQVHSYSWEGTGDTLAYIAGQCQSGNGKQAFCKGNMKRFNELMNEHKQASYKMKLARNQMGENEFKLKSLNSQAQKMGCDLQAGEAIEQDAE